MNGEFFRFLLVGVFNTALGYSVIFFCMYVTGMSPVASNITGYAVGLVASYGLNRTYTFKSLQSKSGEMVRFLGVFVVAFLLNLLVLVVCIDKLHLHDGGSQVLAGIAYVASSYLLNKYYVFKAAGSAHGKAGDS
jgi:putative flippase GtrA